MEIILSESRDLLVLLLVKIGTMASIATVLVRFEAFKRILLGKEDRGRSRLYFPLIIGIILLFGVGVRLLVKYSAVDLSLEGSFLVGMLAGPVAGVVTGLITAAPAFAAGEFLALPVMVLAGFVAGALRAVCPDKETLWNFSPFPLMNLGRFLKTGLRLGKLDWNILFLLTCLGLEGVRLSLAGHFPHRLFDLRAPNLVILFCILYATILCLGIPIKIWNNTRIEILLQEQNALLLQARYEALRRQINPHFLFNTLNSISSSVRTDPEKARTIIIKLSQMFRRLLEQKEDLVPLEDELQFIDSYLAIQEIRYGEEKLRILREIEPQTMGIKIPTMILQPVVENALQHGIAKKTGCGTITIRTKLSDGNAVIEVEDDGPGIAQSEIDPALRKGIGIQNIRERLRVIYGRDSLFLIRAREGEGTRVTITLPPKEA
jgi:two-component system LytT family sensor kinase